jgi:glycosyltransferase involved in cell wall biosynthesis
VTASDASISVVVPVRNGERFLAEALESIAAQTVPPAEVIVVDDGSTDRTADVARRFPVRLLEQEPLGVSAARNAGAAAATCDLVAFGDHDDLWEPDRLERQREAIASARGPAYAVCLVAPFVQPGTPRPEWVTDELQRDGYMALSGGTITVPRDLFATVGGFDPALTHGEDAEWCMRADEAGARRVCTDGPPLLRYRIHDDNTTAAGYMAAPAVLRVLRMAVMRRRGEDPRAIG